MAITINMSVQRSVPQYNDDGLTLVIFKNAVLGAGRGEIVRVDSVQQLQDAFTDPTSLEEFRELYSAEYLVNTGVSLLCYATNVVGTFDSTDVANIQDQKELNYKFIVIPYDFVSNDGTSTTYNMDLMEMVSIPGNEVNAQLYLDLAPDTDQANIEDIITDITPNKSSKVELYINSGFTGWPSRFTVPSTIDISQSTMAEGGAYDSATDYIGIPSSLAVIARKAKILLQGKPWIPIAGETNGLIGEFNSLNRRLYTTEKEAFQSFNVNVLVNRRGVGSLMVSQNTMADSTVSTNPLIRSHVVTEALWFKRWLERLANGVMYRPNNQKTWDLVKLKLSEILESAEDSGGIDSYSVAVGLNITMTEEDIASGILKVNIRYVPVRVIEEIVFDVLIQEREDISEISLLGGDF